MLATMADRERKIKKPQGSLGKNINDSKSHIWISFFFENIISGIEIVCIRPQVPVDIIKVFFNFSKSQSQQKLVKKITDFTIQFRSKNLTHFTSLNPLDIENNMLP